MKRTIKQIKYAYSCVCGFHSVEDTTTTETHRVLRRLGKRSKYADDGTPFYLLKTHSEECGGHSDLDYDDDYD